jgi:anti-anti-sigma regulatory factor
MARAAVRLTAVSLALAQGSNILLRLAFGNIGFFCCPAKKMKIEGSEFMLPQGVEARPDLQVRSDVLAFGFSGTRIPDQTVASLLGSELLNYIATAAASAPAGLVVVDLRNVDSHSAAALGRLLELRQRLVQIGRKLVLLISDPITRTVFSTTHLDERFFIVTDEAEIRALVEHGTLTPVQAPPDEPPELTESELTQMEAGGLTLDDAIRVIKGLRR